MQAIQPIQPQYASGDTNQFLATLPPDALDVQFNLIMTLAHSHCALDSYLQMRRAVMASTLGRRLTEQVSLAVAEAQQCEYGLAAHSLLAGKLGLTPEDIEHSREARSRDPRTRAALEFARDLIQGDNPSLARLRQAGYDDPALLELLALISMNRFANDVAIVAQIAIDHPAPELTANVA